MKNKVLPILLSMGIVACQANPGHDSAAADEHSQIPRVEPSAQTTPTAADGANDPAIWIDTSDPGNSLILGAGLAGGLEVYALDGTRIAAVDGGAITLVDVRSEFSLAGESVGLVMAYDVGASNLMAYTINSEQRSVERLQSATFPIDAEIEGLCMYQSPLSGKSYVYLMGEGLIQQWELYDENGEFAARQVRSMPAGYGAGHCVAHDSGAAIYFSHEVIGVFKLNAEPESDEELQTIDVAQPFGSFAGDVKGITIYEHDDGGYLLASDADASRLQVYDLETLQHVATTSISDVEESEGIAATAVAVGGKGGLLVVTDDDNGDAATNYKIVEWSAFAAANGLTNGTVENPGRRATSAAITVSPIVETEPVISFGDAADDPAIWVNPENPELSVIIGADKKRGINVYDLSGELIQSRADGRINNVDLRYGFQLGDRTVAVVTGSNRTHDSISTYIIDPDTRQLVDVAAGVIDTGMADPYGQCMYKSPTSGLIYVYINDTDGLVRQWVLEDNGAGKIAMTAVREFNVGTQTEGCVADDETGDLYVGEENVGIWKYSAEPDGGDDRKMVDSVDEAGYLTADVEGLSIYYGENGGGYLVASNQGADSYALYERSAENKFIGIFHVVADEATGIDGISETDGLDVNSANLGPDFPQGVFVAQDGRNISPAERQNFKLVPWHRISEAMGLD
ncbi:MAG: phytase [Woeseiaceae bacterium]